jgi:hypothetical protein
MFWLNPVEAEVVPPDDALDLEDVPEPFGVLVAAVVP